MLSLVSPNEAGHTVVLEIMQVVDTELRQQMLQNTANTSNILIAMYFISHSVNFVQIMCK